MRPVTDAAAVCERMNAFLPRLCLTNGLPEAELLEREAEGRRLYLEELPDGLLILLRRDGFFRLRFLLADSKALLLWRPETTVVTEIACRSADRRLIPLIKQLTAQGWRPILRRVRLTRKPSPPEQTAAATPSGLSADEALSLLRQCFSELTGCLPTADELAQDRREGRLLGVEGGLLRYSTSDSVTELRQLAVLPEYRRRGIARQLLTQYLSLAGARRSCLWTGESNSAALSLYQQFGYAPDGWQSQVLLREREIEYGGFIYAREDFEHSI